MLNYKAVALDEIKKQIARPLPTNMDDHFDDYFDPWEPFQFALFGSYSSEFDDVAILVLSNIRDGKWGGTYGEGVAHEMFREILCKADLCDYGSSPRSCFATDEFKAILPALVGKWVAYRALWDA